MKLRTFLFRQAINLAWAIHGGAPVEGEPLKGFSDVVQAAERRAASNGAWAILLFGLLATSWEAALLWFLPK